MRVAPSCLVLSVLVVLRPVRGFYLRAPLTVPSEKQTVRAEGFGMQLRSPRVVKATHTISTRKEMEDQQHHRFDWKNQWYPVLALKSSDPLRVHAVQLLGKDLVVWRNKEGRWSTLDDRCPHRAAPLTEGRVEKDGSLLCAYHAWRFDSDGRCLSIPQSERGGKDEGQERACAKAYPTQVAQDIIWVWADNGPDAGLQSALNPAALIPELDDAEGIKSGRITAGSISQRDLPYAWETFMENVVDPSHVVVSHHGVMGTRDMAAPVKLELPASAVNKGGFECTNKSPMWKGTKGSTYFVAPSLARTDTKNEDGSMVSFVVYNMPASPGRSRMLVRQMSVLPKVWDNSKRKPKMVDVVGLGGLVQPHQLPAWLQHILGHMVINQDLATLHHQEKILASAGGNYFRSTFVPAAADRAVVALRFWILKHASGGPVWAGGCDTTLPPREHRREDLFNVYEQHTKNCTSCLGAVRGIKHCLRAAKISAVVSLAWAVLKGAHVGASALAPGPVINPATTRAMLPGLLVTLASLAGIKMLQTLLSFFYTGNHRHQDHD